MQLCAAHDTHKRPKRALPCAVQAAKRKLLRAFGWVWLGGAALHAYNCYEGLQRPGVTLAWGGFSVALGLLCLWRGYRRERAGDTSKQGRWPACSLHTWRWLAAIS